MNILHVLQWEDSSQLLEEKGDVVWVYYNRGTDITPSYPHV